MSSTPIAAHALLSDRHSSALVDSAGSVEWLGFPRYVDRTLALRTTFVAAGGAVVLTDALAMGPDNGGHRLGKDVPHLLVRRLTCTAGEVEVEMRYEPRPEYGLIVPVPVPVLVLAPARPRRCAAKHRRGVAVVAGSAPVL